MTNKQTNKQINKLIHWFLFMLVLLGRVPVASAEAVSTAPEIFTVPSLTSPVMDLAGVMTPSGRARVEKLTRTLFEGGGSQISVLTVPTLAELSIEEASIKIVDQWKLGHKGKDDGVLLLVAPKERKLRIEVGRGKEGDLPDAIARRIISQVISPAFRQGHIDDGMLLGVAAIIQKTDPDFDLEAAGAPRPRLRGHRGGGGSNLLTLIFILFFILLTPILAVLRMMGLIPRGGISSGYYGGSGWGGGSSGSDSGGSWGGGGGGFSGGGSSGSW